MFHHLFRHYEDYVMVFQYNGQTSMIPEPTPKIKTTASKVFQLVILMLKYL